MKQHSAGVPGRGNAPERCAACAGRCTPGQCACALQRCSGTDAPAATRRNACPSECCGSLGDAADPGGYFGHRSHCHTATVNGVPGLYSSHIELRQCHIWQDHLVIYNCISRTCKGSMSFEILAAEFPVTGNNRWAPSALPEYGSLDENLRGLTVYQLRYQPIRSFNWGDTTHRIPSSSRGAYEPEQPEETCLKQHMPPRSLLLCAALQSLQRCRLLDPLPAASGGLFAGCIAQGGRSNWSLAAFSKSTF